MSVLGIDAVVRRITLIWPVLIGAVPQSKGPRPRPRWHRPREYRIRFAERPGDMVRSSDYASRYLVGSFIETDVLIDLLSNAGDR